MKAWNRLMTPLVPGGFEACAWPAAIRPSGGQGQLQEQMSWEAHSMPAQKISLTGSFLEGQENTTRASSRIAGEFLAFCCERVEQAKDTIGAWRL